MSAGAGGLSAQPVGPARAALCPHNAAAAAPGRMVSEPARTNLSVIVRVARILCPFKGQMDTCAEDQKRARVRGEVDAAHTVLCTREERQPLVTVLGGDRPCSVSRWPLRTRPLCRGRSDRRSTGGRGTSGRLLNASGEVSASRLLGCLGAQASLVSSNLSFRSHEETETAHGAGKHEAIPDSLHREQSEWPGPPASGAGGAFPRPRPLGLGVRTPGGSLRPQVSGGAGVCTRWVSCPRSLTIPRSCACAWF